MLANDMRINRLETKEQLIYSVFKTRNSYAALVGSSGVGKSELAKEAATEWLSEPSEGGKKAVVHYTIPGVKRKIAYRIVFWSGLISALVNALTGRNELYVPDPSFEAFKEILQQHKDRQVTLVIDELENLKMENGGEVGRILEQLMQLKEDGLGVSVLLISQKSLAEIPALEACWCVSAYATLPLTGFDEMEWEQYAKNLQNALSVEVKVTDRIRYYCGNNPRLLMELYLELKREQSIQITTDVVDTAFQRCLENAWVKKFYEAGYKRLLAEWLPDEEEAVKAWLKIYGKDYPDYLALYCWEKRLDEADRIFFIGREEKIKELREKVFQNDCEKGRYVAVTGPNEIGKTELVNRARGLFEKERSENTIVVGYLMPADTKQENQTKSFWSAIFNEIGKADTVADLKLRNKDFADRCERLVNCSGNVELDVSDAFEELHSAGFNIILILDEFDNVIGKYEELFFSVFINLHEKEYRPTILLLARGGIVEPVYNKQFVKMFDEHDSIILSGFNDEEWKCYEDSLGFQIGCIRDGETQTARDRILYYCGRHVKMLMVMRDALRKMYMRQKEIYASDVEECYKNGAIGNGPTVRTKLDDVCAHLKEVLEKDCIEVGEDKNCMGPYIEVCMNMPIHAKEMEKWKNTLYSRGYIMESGEKYEAISPWALDYIAEKSTKEDLATFEEYAKSAEKAVRKCLLTPLINRYGDKETLKTVIFEFLNPFGGNKEKFYASLEEQAEKSGVDIEKSGLSVLDVLAYPEYFKIMVGFWETNFAARTRLSMTKEYRDVIGHNTEDELFGAQNIRAATRLKEAIEHFSELIKICEDADSLRGLRSEPLPWHTASWVGAKVKFEALSHNKKEFTVSGYMYLGDLPDMVYEASIEYGKREGKDENQRVVIDSDKAEAINWVGRAGMHDVKVDIAPAKGNGRSIYVVSPVEPEYVSAPRPTVPTEVPGNGGSATVKRRREVEPRGKQKKCYLNFNKFQELHELSWEDDSKKEAICGYLYCKEDNKLKFKARMEKDAVSKFAKKGIDFSSEFPETLDVEVLGSWDETAKVFKVGCPK